MINELLGD